MTTGIEFNAYMLRKWRARILVRDCIQLNGVRHACCILCNNIFAVYKLQIHHIYPKSRYPSRAYDLYNGVCLCLACHMMTVHGGNSFEDVYKRKDHWRFFVPSFRRYVELSKVRQFNDEHQSFVSRSKRRGAA